MLSSYRIIIQLILIYISSYVVRFHHRYAAKLKQIRVLTTTLILLLHKQLQQSMQLVEVGELGYSPERLQSISNLLKREETRLLIQYSIINIHTLQFNDIANHTAIQLSKMIFQQQLKLIQTKFQLLPDLKCSLEQFVLIMLQVLEVTLEKAAASIIGLKEMFEVIAANARFITYQNLFKYVIGLSTISSTFRETIFNTDFRMEYVESRQQDFLLHDQGIEQILYMDSLKLILCLDKECHYLRIYNKDLRLIGKFCPNGDSHGNKQPKIKAIAVNDLAYQVGLALKDQTLVIFNVHNFINQSPQEFLMDPSNEDFQEVDFPITRLFFFETWGQYIIQCQQKRNQLYRIDFYRKHGSRVQKINGLPDVDIVCLFQIPLMNQIVFASGAEVYFYNQSLSEHIHTFQHSTKIHTLHHHQKKFFVCGYQDSITMFEYDKVSKDFKVKVMETHTKVDIETFEIFVELGIIMFLDEKYQLQVIELNKYTVYQPGSYKHVSRLKHSAKSFKLNKNEMFIFGAYIIRFDIERRPLKKEIEIKMSDCYGISYETESLFLFLDNMLMELSVLRGTLSEVYTPQNSNISPLSGFLILPQNQYRPILFSQDSDIYDLYSTDDNSSSNKDDRRRIPLDFIIGCSSCPITQTLSAWSQDKLFQITSKGNNNYQVINSISLKLDKIKECWTSVNDITLWLHNGHIVTIDKYTLTTTNVTNYVLPTQHIVDVLGFHRVGDLDILLCNNNVLVLIGNGKEVVRIMLEECVSSKIEINFSKIKYNDLIKKDLGIEEKGVFALDDNGFVLYIPIDKDVVDTLKIDIQEPKRRSFEFVKGAQTVDLTKSQNIKVNLSKKYSPKWTKLIKSHDVIVTQAILVYFQTLAVITYAHDGLVKMWGYKNSHLFFSIRLPNFIHNTWDMQTIHQKRADRNISKTNNLLSHLKQLMAKKVQKPNVLLHKSKAMKIEKDTLKKKRRAIEDILEINLEPEFQEYTTINQFDTLQNTLRGVRFSKGFRERRFVSQTKPSWNKPQFLSLVSAADKKRHGEQLPKELQTLREVINPRSTRRVSRSNDVEDNLSLPQITLEKDTGRLNDIEETLGKITARSGFEGVQHLRVKKSGPRFNLFDEIDREFEAKREYHKRNMMRKLVNQKIERERELNVSEIELTKQPPLTNFIDNIKRIFQDHNRQVSINKRGHYISLPKMSTTREP